MYGDQKNKKMQQKKEILISWKSDQIFEPLKAKEVNQKKKYS